ncbi:RHS domain-containing protein [Paraburkholderia sp. J67]|uniref:RHS domain-containing protein n=1 Tax=Paraburkholderia sp. J67 TaxID=2805435 RepID=UPI0039F45423
MGSYAPLARVDRDAPAANDESVHDAVYYFHNDVSGTPEELTVANDELVWQAPDRPERHKRPIVGEERISRRGAGKDEGMGGSKRRM